MTATSASPPSSAADRFDGTGQNPGRDFLVRSEEQLRFATDRVVAGYARLEKFTVTETQTVTVEVAHEEVRLVQLASAGQPADSRELAETMSSGDADRWMVLSREEVVVTKRLVPVERVRLEVYPVTEQRQVTEQVRKEQIDTTPQTNWTAEHDGGSRDLPPTTPVERTYP